MALSGVRSSWLILARNCDLCWLASSSCRLLSWISSNSRTFSIAIPAWSAKVVAISICFSVKGRTVSRISTMAPIGLPSRISGTARTVRNPSLLHILYRVVWISQNVRNLDGFALKNRAAEDATPSRLKRDSAENHLPMLGRAAVSSYDLIFRALLAMHDRNICIAQSRSRLRQRIEHGLQIERRAADDLEDVGGRGLLLQQLPQLVQQSDVVDRDGRLVSEGLNQSDLLVRERPDLLQGINAHDPK